MITERPDETTWEFAESAIMWKWKRLFVNGCEDKNPIRTAKEIRISMRGDGDGTGYCGGIRKLLLAMYCLIVSLHNLGKRDCEHFLCTVGDI